MPPRVLLAPVLEEDLCPSRRPTCHHQAGLPDLEPALHAAWFSPQTSVLNVESCSSHTATHMSEHVTAEQQPLSPAQTGSRDAAGQLI